MTRMLAAAVLFAARKNARAVAAVLVQDDGHRQVIVVGRKAVLAVVRIGGARLFG